MARNTFTHTNTVAVALVAATEKSALQLIAGTAIVAVTGVDITFDGISNTAVPIIVKLITTSTAGTLTARNPIKTTDRATALLVTGGENASAEGTNGNIMKIFHVHPQGGVYYPFSAKCEIEIPNGGRLALKLTAPANVNCLATLHGEE